MNVSHDKLLSQIPDWVRWIAQDSSGIWWGYSVEPLRNECGWYENEVGRHIKLDKTEPTSWKKSLSKTNNHSRPGNHCVK